MGDDSKKRSSDSDRKQQNSGGRREIEPERAIDPLQTSVSNFGFAESQAAGAGGLVTTYSLGEDRSGLANVPNFQLRVKGWSEPVPDDLKGLPHISKLFPAPESVCEADDRILIGNTTVAPWKFICKVYIDRKWVGSGYFIGPRCIITNGHVVYPNRAWAHEIIVAPGQNGGQAPFGMQASRRFVSVKGWTDKENPDYDYGAIILPDDQLYSRLQGFMGYRILVASEILNNSGYPIDKAEGTQWYNAGPIHTLGEHRFFYMIDTYGGQSGSPVFVGPSSNATAVGVHGYGGCPNSAVRIIEPVAVNFSRWRQTQ